MPPIVAILAGLLKPLMEWFQTEGKVLLEKLLIYRKGMKDQQRKDDIARLEREGKEVSRATERIEEGRREAMERDASSRPDSDSIRVRRPSDEIKW